VPDREDPFELEDERPAKKVPATPVNGAARPAEPKPKPKPEPARPASRPEPGEEGVDTRTVAERQGRAVEGVSGARPPPPGWPREAFRFPLRAPGPVLIAGWGALLALLDGVGTTPLWILVLFLKLPVLLFLLRWFLHEAGMSAGGLDRPSGIARVLELERQSLKQFGGIAVCVLLALAPGAILLWREQVGWAIVVLLLGSAWLSTALLGAAVWIVNRPLGLLAGASGLWAAVAAEVAAFSLANSSFLTATLAALSLRAAFLYLWLVSARAVGVLGRAWTPWEEDARTDAKG
jgi:hypothetical protein